MSRQTYYKYNLYRFTRAHKKYYETALNEIRQGHIQSKWVDFIFPHVIGRDSDDKDIYAISSRAEARAYIDNETLRTHLLECTEALLAHKGKPLEEIFSEVADIHKVISSMTLFCLIYMEHFSYLGRSIFSQVREAVFGNRFDIQAYDLIHSVPWLQREKFAEIEDEVSERATRMVEKEMGLSEDEYMLGMCHLIWAKEKEILKNEYGIDWKTPSELDPDTRYD